MKKYLRLISNKELNSLIYEYTETEERKKKSVERWAKWRTSPAGERLGFHHDMHEGCAKDPSYAWILIPYQDNPSNLFSQLFTKDHWDPHSGRAHVTIPSLGLALAFSYPSQVMNPVKKPLPALQARMLSRPWVNALLHKPSHNQPSFVWLQDIAGDFWWLGSGNMTDSKQLNID